MEENYGFVGREFGRSFKPQGTNEEIDHFGQIIAERMEGKRAGFGATDEALPVFEAFYLDTLDLLEEHFTTTPYLFGGRPSVADFALMGPLFGHLARDPMPSTIMKQRAPRVFRWIEAMNTPHIQSPEFADFDMAFAPNDELPGKTLHLLALSLEAFGQNLPRIAEIYNAWVQDRSDEPANTMVSKDMDEPVIGRFETVLRGVPIQNSASLYTLWVHQRTLNWFEAQPPEVKKISRDLLSDLGAEAMLDISLKRPLTRVHSHIALG